MRVLALLLFAFQMFGAYSYQRKITVAAVAATQTDFPVLIQLDSSNVGTTLKVVGSGGHVQNANAYDVGFFSDSFCTSALFWEVEKYDGTNGLMLVHVKFPSLSGSASTDVYVCYGDATKTTFQSTTTSVWSTSHKAVYHLVDGTTPSAFDSTVNANNGTLVNAPAAITGMIDGGIRIQRGAGFDRAVNLGAGSSLNITGTDLTISAWIKRNVSTAIGSIIARGVGGVGGYNFNINATDFTFIKQTAASLTVGTIAADTNWHMVDLVASGTGVVVYVDGTASAGTSANTSSIATYTGDALLGPAGSSTTDNDYNVDEVRISNAARSAEWVAIKYANQSSPLTFIAVAAEGAPFVNYSPTKFHNPVVF